ncbi:MAG: ATP-binding cassette domain-containing protein [Gemmatimonadota bacterium]
MDLEIGRGTCHCLTGATGSGKTSLILALKGLLAGGRREGAVELGARSGRPPRVGVVLQDPETQLLAATVGPEVAFGLENLGVDPASMPDRARSALAAAGLEAALDRPVEHLSMGQKYRLVLAGALAMEPDLLALDEPSAQLDPEGLARLREVMVRLKAAGVSFLVCEHAPGWAAGVADEWWHLAGEEGLEPRAAPESSGPAPEGSPPWPGAGIGGAQDGATAPGPAGSPRPADADGPGAEAIWVRALELAGPGGGPLWPALSFGVAAGACAAVCGPNGSGKTTLLRSLMGFVPPARGQVRVLGEAPRPEALRGRAGCLFQNPSRQLFEDTVRAEVAFGPTRQGLKGRALEERVGEALRRCGLTHLAGGSPHRLSFGQKHLVALAAALALDPAVLLLDEPLAGLDPGLAATVLALLREQAADRDAAICWTTHHPDAVPAWAAPVLRLERPGAV